ncbi:MAG TPA: hypothetical protein ENK02_15560 [Planctomycetes bacterium]|nr:hypothetical protein [Planctomycetota bacterium]
MKHSFLLSAAVATLSTTAFSQLKHVVVPASAATKDGTSYHWCPTRYNPNHTQCFYSSKTVGTGFKIFREIGIRSDAVRTTSAVNKTWDIEIQMSNISQAPGKHSWLFSKNLVGGTKVFPRKKISLPAPTKPPAGKPAAFFRIPLAKPFLYKNQTLVVDFQTFGLKETKYWYADAQDFTITGNNPDYGGAKITSTACPTNFTMYRAGGNWPGGAIGFYGYSRVQANTAKPGFLILGASNTKWGAFTLPLDLTVAGAKGCKLGVSMDILIPTVTEKTRADGYVSNDLPIPNISSLGGVTIHAQYMVVDPGFNSLNLRFSNTYSNTIGKNGFPKAMEGFMLYNYYSQPTYDVGIYNKTRALVLELGY